MADSINQLDIFINSDTTNKEGFYLLLSVIRPDWKHDEIEISVVKGGFVNKSLCAHVSKDIDKQDAVLIHVDASHNVYTLDQSDIVAGLHLASRAGCIPPIYAFFKNGFAQKFVNIEKITYQELFAEPNCGQLGSALAKIHSLKSQYQQHPGISRELIIFRRIRKVIDVIPDSFHEKFPENQEITEYGGMNKNWLNEQLSTLRKYFQPGSMRVVLGHGDVHVLNVLKEKGKDQLFVCDFDLCGLSYDAYDFAYMRHLAHALQLLGVLSEWRPSDEDWYRLIGSYLRTRKGLDTQNKPAGGVTEEEIVEFYQNTLNIAPVYLLFSATLGARELCNKLITVPKDLMRRSFHDYIGFYIQHRHWVIPDK